MPPNESLPPPDVGPSASGAPVDDATPRPEPAPAAESAPAVSTEPPASQHGPALDATPAQAQTQTRTAPADCGPKLKELFPALFSGAPKPLKLRIQVDIQERAPGVFSKQALSAFFRRYTGSTSYLLALVRSKHRFDLDGQPAGEISDENRKVASDELARRRASQESRRELEDQQRRNRARLLHDFEQTTLTRANFCALKEVAEDELDNLLAIARTEAAQARASAPRHDMERHPRRDTAHPPRREGRDEPRGRSSRPPRPQGRDRPR